MNDGIRERAAARRVARWSLRLGLASAGLLGGAAIFGYLTGTVTIHGDIVAPTGKAWEADG